MKVILIGLVVFALLLLGFVYFTNTGDLPASPTTNPTSTPTSTTPVDEPMNEPDDEPEVPQGSYLHAEPTLQYTIALPHEVDVSSPQDSITRYRFVGSESEVATEITDGYIIAITAMPTNATTSAAIAAQDIQRNRSNVLAEPAVDQLAGQAVMYYVTESELGSNPITHYAFVPQNGYAYIASVNISPPEHEQYLTITEQILDSLQFLNKNESEAFAARTIPIAMLDYGAVGGNYVKDSGGSERGCDKVVLIEHILAQATTTPLNASLHQLFTYEHATVAGWQNFIVSQNDHLSFDHAEITDRTAHIYLTGELGPLGGVCDNPRTAIQIEETALAYPTIDSVRLYLNGEPTDLSPDGRGLE